jgi:anti-sigma-K factor RskA
VNSAHVTESIPAFALECLDPEERELVARHLARCPDCQAELRAYQRLVGDLSLAVPGATPPAGLRQKILHKAIAPSLQPVTQPGILSRLGHFFRAALPAWGGVSLLLVVALVISNIVAWQQVQSRPNPSTFHVVTLTSTDSSQKATALLVISDGGKYGTLVTDNMTVLGSQQQYQLWLIKDGQRTSGGVFSVNSSGYGWLKVESQTSLLDFQSFGVTIEPKGGSAGPTGVKVLGSG